MISPTADMNSWLSRLVPGLDMDWRKLLLFDRIQKVCELLFWGYLVSVLQFAAGVRKEFFPPPPSGEEGKRESPDLP
jgi:hypothetical protein